jgi:peptide/nickel transport system permease protein
MAGASPLSQPPGLRAWLLSPEPGSRLQARLGRGYLGWRAFSRNPLAVLGLAIVVMLILVALFADFIAPY